MMPLNIVRAYSTLSGVVFVLIGAFQMLISLGIDLYVPGWMLIYPDLIRASVLLLIGVIFFSGSFRAGKGRDRVVSFSLIGTGLAYLLSLTSILLLASAYIELALIGGEEFIFTDHVGPGIYLVVIPLAGSLLLRSSIREQEVL